MDKRWGFLILGLILTITMSGQVLEQLSLQDAYHLLEQRYPNLRNGSLLTDIQTQQQAQLQAAYRPNIYLKADGQFQSESVSLDAGEVMLPFEIDRPLGTAKTYVEASYLLIDGGLEAAQEKMIDLETTLHLQELEVERYSLRGQVNKWFLQVAQLRAHADLFTITLKNLQAREAQVKAAVDYGVTLESEWIKIKVKQKELEAQQIDLNYRMEAALSSLAQLLEVELDTTTLLDFPELPDLRSVPAITRPEQNVFVAKQEMLYGQNALIDAERGPKLNLFAQAGVGYPNPLNFLDSDPATYGIIGAGFSWKLTDWNKRDLQRQEISLRVQQLQNAEESFLFNLDQQTASYLAEIDRLEAQIRNEEEIAVLQADILTQMAAQLDGGVITATDYLIQLNEELLARQQIVIHQLQLQQLQLNFWNARGGF